MSDTFQLTISKISDKLRSGGERVRNVCGTKTSLVILTTFIGILCGAAAALLKFLIASITSLFTPGSLFTTGSVWLIIVPLLGIMLTGIVCRYLFKTKLEHGCEQLAVSLKEGKYRMNKKLTFAPIIASSITLGCGGSAGSEGPIAYTGAALGSNVGKLFKMPDHIMMILIGCGAGAGIAGIFKAPIGGALFTLEVLGMALNTTTIIALMSCCLAAGATAYLLSGCTLDVPYFSHIAFEFNTTGAVLLLGIFCGVYSVYYSFWMKQTRINLDRLQNPWVKNLIAGSTIAILIYLFPTLYGEGYNVADKLINNQSDNIFGSALLQPGTSTWAIIGIVAAILAVKAIATQSTNSGGGVAGDFAPTLFAGSLAGFLFALTANTVAGTSLPTANFALYGMAGVMAGAIKAPLMAIFLVVEMTGDYGLFFPIMLTALASYSVILLQKTLRRK